MSTKETIVMSVGGSLIVPSTIDTVFLSSLKTLIEHQIALGRRFIIVTGGGRTARTYADAAKSVATLDSEDLDWLGIHATRLNGHLLRTIFKDSAYPVMLTNPDDIYDVPKNSALIVAAGYRPGSSSDLQAVKLAERMGATRVVNLSNIEYVYTADPRTNPGAQKIEDITWAEFRKLIPEKWDPGLSSPFDPVAARHAQEKDIEVACISGAHLDALENYLNGKPFIGTRIHT
jgi:uridylate kinase